MIKCDMCCKIVDRQSDIIFINAMALCMACFSENEHLIGGSL